MARWDVAGAVIAIIATLLTMSPVAITLFSSLFLAFVRLLWPSSAQSERLQWIDIPDGPLHHCILPMEQCRHFEGLNPITEFFTLIKRGIFVPKPRQLHWRSTYVRTDSTVLKAFLLLNFEATEKNLKLSWHPIGRHLIARFLSDSDVKHVIPVGKAVNLTLSAITKSELGYILQGYPPWYRSHLPLANGAIVPHPILSFADVSRGGWIAAVGLSRATPLHSYCMVTEPLNGNFKLIHVAAAFDRILYRLHALQETFPEHAESLKEAHELITLLRHPATCVHVPGGPRVWNGSVTYNHFSDSCFTRLFGDGWFDHHKRGEGRRKFVQSLSKEECVLIMEVFAKYGSLTKEVVEGLRGCLLSALRVVLVGCWEVYVYVNRLGRRVVWETELEGEKVVWLKIGPEDED